MNRYNITDKQKEVLRCIVNHILEDNLPENFKIYSNQFRTYIFSNQKKDIPPDIEKNMNKELFVFFEQQGLIEFAKIDTSDNLYSCLVTQKAIDAVKSDFNEPDTSFLKYITPLTDVSNLDNELKQRCLPMLGADSSDPTLWDSAVRTAGVILENRLRQKGQISNPNIIGQKLVNKIFSNKGTLASKFTIDSERQGYRDLYAGIIGSYRNPSAHRLIDPTPEEGGAFIIFVDLLLKKIR